MRSLLLVLVAVLPFNAFGAEISAKLVTTPPPAECGLAHCPQVEAGLDEVDGLDALRAPAYAWLVEDLHLARLALSEGDEAAALEIADAAHFSLVMQGEHIAELRGQDFVFDMHDALAAVIVAAGGEEPAIPELD